MRHKTQRVYIQREQSFETTGTNHRLVFGIVRTPVLGESKRDRERALALRWSVGVIATAVAYYLLVLTDVGPLQ